MCPKTTMTKNYLKNTGGKKKFQYHLPQFSIFGHILEMTDLRFNHILYRSIKIINIS